MHDRSAQTSTSTVRLGIMAAVAACVAMDEKYKAEQLMKEAIFA